MERVAILVQDETVGADHLAFLAQGPGERPGAAQQTPRGPFDLGSELQRIERALVLEVLERNGWQMSKSAQDLNLERSHLYKKLKALGIERPSED